MEIELKYRIKTQEIAEEIWKDKMFFHLEEEGSREEMCFDAKYYDTENWALSNEEMAEASEIVVQKMNELREIALNSLTKKKKK